MPTNQSKGARRREELQAFVNDLKNISRDIGFKVSARGWCYILENAGKITKDQFELVNGWINESVKLGILDVDFVAEDSSRLFSGVEHPEERSVVGYFKDVLQSIPNVGDWYTPDWWANEDYYIQVVVEKVDLKTLFEPIATQYHIPIANARGWSSILQRAQFARRFKEAEEQGKWCVLLYCGDHDPDGLRISQTMRKNLEDIQDITWSDGEQGYDPSNLTIERFGLNYDFIMEHNLSWIDNLTTGSGKNLASPQHKNHNLPYVQDYLKQYGERKCEANALVVAPAAGQRLFENSVKKYLGEDALVRFAELREQVKTRFKKQVFDKIRFQEFYEKAMALRDE